MDLRGFNIQKLAKSAGLNPPIISMHFSGKRPMRMKHLKSYLRAFTKESDQNTLYLSWMKDHGPNMHVPAMFWVDDVDASCVVISNQWLEFTGRTSEQELGYGWIESIHPDDRDKVIRARAGRKPFFVKHRLRRHDGVYLLFGNQGQPYFNDGHYAGFVGCAVLTTR